MNVGPNVGLRVAVALLVAALLLVFPYIDLAVDLDLYGRHVDTPLADLIGVALVPLALVFALYRRPPSPGPAASTGDRLRRALRTLQPPGLLGYAALVGVGLAALAWVPDPGGASWFLLRKPVFLYVAYGVALATLVAHVLPRAALLPTLRLALAVTATVSLASSVGRIAAGNTLWFSAIAGLTNNHKTLAVAMAPLVPLLLGLRRGRLDLGVAALALIAIAASLSRTAWISTAVGLAFLVVWRGGLLAARRGLVVGVVVTGVLVALYGPLLLRSHAQLDAARSRHSLDKRALEMVAAWPLAGMGGGANVRYEMQTFPHYRVNGVDAHGAVQKVTSEYGLLGLLGYGGFVAAMATRLRRQADLGLRAPDGLAPPNRHIAFWAAFLALHANLLLSTETFTQTHWVPLGIVWGLSRRGSSR